MALNDLDLPKLQTQKQLKRTTKKETRAEQTPAFLRGEHSTSAPSLDKHSDTNFMRRIGVLPPETQQATVNYVYDGDSVFLQDGREVRLLGINTPEVSKADGTPAEPFGIQARDHLRELLKGNRNVALTFETVKKDKYGRTLAHILTQDGKDVQAILLQSGEAKALSIPPNTNMTDFYATLEKQAKAGNIGLWKKPIESVPEGYIPAYMRGDYTQRNIPTPPTPIGTALELNLINDSMTRWIADIITDINRPEKTLADDKDIQKNIDNMIKTAGLPPAIKEPILELAKSKEHAQQLIDRAVFTQQHAGGLAAMGFFSAAAAGIGGFVLDPLNSAPGLIELKLATKVAVALPKLAAIVTKAAPTLTGKTVRWTAFGATEELLRELPRLRQDPTFTAELYLENAGYAAIFSAGLMRGIPAAKWFNNKAIAPGFKKLNEGIDIAFRKAKENAALRTTANVMHEVVSKTARSERKAVIQKGINDLDKTSILRRAQRKAKEQVAQSSKINKLWRVAKNFHNKLNKKDLDLTDPTLRNEFRKAIKESMDIANDGSNTEAMQNFIRKVQEFDARAIKKTPEEINQEKINAEFDAPEKLNQQQIDNAFADVPTTPDLITTIPEALHEVEQLRQFAIDALYSDKTLPIKTKNTLLAAVEANASEITRSLEAAAARNGVKVIRRTAKRKDIVQTIQERVNRLLPDKRSKQITTALNQLGIKDATLGDQQAFKNVITSMKINVPTGKTAREAVLNWILANAKTVHQRAATFRENITTEFNRQHEDIQALYRGNPSDSKFVQLQEHIRQAQEELEFTFDWAAMNWERKATDLNKIDPKWALLSNEFEQSIEPAIMRQIDEIYASASQRLVKAQFGKLTRSLGSDLMETKVPLAKWQAMNIFELAPGLGGLVDRPQTAVLIAESNLSDIMTPALVAYNQLIDDAARAMDKTILGRGLLKRLNPNTDATVRQINRQVMREVSARQDGKNINSPDYIHTYVDELQKTNDALYKLQQDHGIEGITGANKMKHYIRQAWHDGAILDMIDNTSIGRNGVLELLSKSMHSKANGRLSQGEANTLAESLLDLKLEAMNRPTVDMAKLRSENLSQSMASIEDIIKRVVKNNKSRDIQNILNWVREDVGGKPGYVNKRYIDLDYETTITRNGQTVSILDLLDNDVIGQVNRYAKEASGRAALSEASQGKITSDQHIDDLLQATAQQANDMGTHVNTKDMRNAYRQLLGLPYDGQLQLDVRKIRDAISLSGMNGLGESQLAELGLSINRGFAGLFAMNQLASKTTARLKMWAGMKLTDKQKGNLKFLNELQEASRLYEDMHILQRQNVHFDARVAQRTTGFLHTAVDTLTGGKYRPYLQYLQTRYTGYGAVRTMEEQLAMSSLMQDAMKKVRSGKSFTTDKRFADIGLKPSILKKYLDNNTITLRQDGNIETLNLHRWSKADQQSIGIALRRHADQVVQKTNVGEASALATDPRVAFLMQFKSYPLAAAEKQMARNMLFHDKEAGMGIVLNAASSASARALRYYSMSLALPERKRKNYLENKFQNDFRHDSIQYMGIVGMMSNNWDMAQDLVFGNESSIGDQLPAINWADNYMTAAKSANPMDGYNERDVANAQRGMPLGTIMWMNGFMGILRTFMDTDADANYSNPTDRNRGN